MRGRRVTSLGLAQTSKKKTSGSRSEGSETPRRRPPDFHSTSSPSARFTPKGLWHPSLPFSRGCRRTWLGVEQWLREKSILPAVAVRPIRRLCRRSPLPENTLRADSCGSMNREAEEKPKPPQSKKRSQPQRNKAKRLLRKIFPGAVSPRKTSCRIRIYAPSAKGPNGTAFQTTPSRERPQSCATDNKDKPPPRTGNSVSVIETTVVTTIAVGVGQRGHHRHQIIHRLAAASSASSAMRKLRRAY